MKGPGSVAQGIQWVQDQKISITRRSDKTIKAYNNYLWRVNKDGKVINEVDDTIHEWSNPMDAIRYGLSSFKSTHTEKEKILEQMQRNQSRQNLNSTR